MSSVIGKIAFRTDAEGVWVRAGCNGETIECGPHVDRAAARKEGIAALAEILGKYWAPGYPEPCPTRIVGWEDVS